ncbi:MAG: hypothetical protein H6799_00995 [Candidatus Nomurabacteria bacterium]|nr:MAG: hypothetical protein H6799_00995 [Candidatus Nomurabacteria bacterium]HRV76190.1 hypothetical protein [Candidatus Saccharimonadales bacterium]
MTDLFLLVLGVLAVVLAGVNLRSLGNSLIFSVSVLGKHADMRRMGINSLVFWLGTTLIVGPALVLCWQVSSALVSLGGLSYRLSAYSVSTLLIVWGLFNLYVYKVGPRRDSEGRLRSKIINLSRNTGTITQDFIFGMFNGFSVIASELGIFIGGIWLIQTAGGFGFAELGVVILAATSAIWAIYMSLLYGANLSVAERFRKAHGAKVSFVIGFLGVFGSWLVLAKSMGLI